MDLNVLDIDSGKDQDTCDGETLRTDFSHQYHAAAWQSVSLKKEPTYITHLSASSDFSQLVAALSDFTLSLHDGASLKQVTTLRGHQKKITGSRFLPGNDNIVVSSSLDGSIYQWDTRTGGTVMEQKDSTLEQPKPLTCVDVNAAGRFICAGTELVGEDSFLVFWDVRKPVPLGGYWESHTDEISEVRFHPTDSGALVTASTDGYINVFDVTQTTEDDALVSTLNTESSVRSITWYEVSDVRHLAVVLDTEELQCWNLQSQDKICHFSRTGITESIRRTVPEVCYLAGCHPMSTDGDLITVAGTDTKEGGGCLRLLKLRDGEKLTPHSVLEDSEVQQQMIRCSVFNPQTEVLVTGGEGGVVTLWRPGAAGDHKKPRETAGKVDSHKARRHRKHQPY